MDFSNMFAFGAQAGSQASQIIPIIVGIAVTLIQCFFGFKLFRYIMGFWGFALFAYVGYIVSNGFGNQTVTIAVSVIFGAVGAFIAYKYYKAGVFLQGLIAGFLIGIVIAYFMGWSVGATFAFALVVGILLGLLTSYLLRPLIILTSGISGGMASGAAIVRIFNFNAEVGVLLGVILTILGVGFQFYSIGKDKGEKQSKKDKDDKSEKKRKGDKAEKKDTEEKSTADVSDAIAMPEESNADIPEPLIETAEESAVIADALPEKVEKDEGGEAADGTDTNHH